MNMSDDTIFINRELSWLDFNRRVLALGKDKNVPLAERVKFLAIYGSNLDEFFMVRVGSLQERANLEQEKGKKEKRENKTNMTAAEQLAAIMPKTAQLQEDCDKYYAKALEALAENGYRKVDLDHLTKEDEHVWKKYFQTELFPILSPQIVDNRHPFPFLRNKEIYLGVLLKEKHPAGQSLGIIPISSQMERIHFIKKDGETLFALTEELVLHFAASIFGKETILEKCLFRVTRNADIDVKEGMMDHDIDYREIMTELLKRRRKLAAVRLQITPAPAPEVERLLCLGKQLNYVWSVSELDKKKKLRSKKIAGIRGWIQAAATLLTNPHIPNFFQGKIYQGKAKTVCVPGLNCYSCPAATGACPIGAFQAVVGSSKFKFSYYITGFLILLGVTLGRFICGFLCPFGWFQDLLHKIPGKKFSTARLKPLRYLKYIILVVFVILLPMFATNSIGMGDPFFCKYICPQGVLEGAIPLSIGNAAIRSALGKLFSFKFGILITVVVLSILFYRPFCKWICPLGAIYSLFNKVSFLHITIENSKCVGCNQCSRACKMDIDVCRTPNHPECIRCGACIKACPKDAIHYQFLGKTCQKKDTGDQQSEIRNH